MRSIFVLLILVMIGLNGKGQSVTALPDSVLSQCCLEVTLLNGNATTVDWVFIQYIARDGTGTKLFVEYAPNFGGIQWETQIRIQDDFDDVIARSKFIVIPFTVGTTDYGINRNWIANIEENTTTGGTWIYGRFGTPAKRKFSAVEDYETMKNLLLACRPRAIVVAENGLYTEGDTVRMGGFLIENTRVQLEGYPLTFIDTTAKQSFGVGAGTLPGYLGDTVGYFGRRSGGFRQFILQGNRYNQIVIRDTSSVFGDYAEIYQGLYFGDKPYMYLDVTDREFDGKISRISIDADSVSFRNSPYLSSIDAYIRYFTAKAGRISMGAIEGELGITGTGVEMGAYGYGIGGGASEYLFMKTKAVDNGTASVGQYLKLLNTSTGEVDFATIDLSAYLPIADTAAMLLNYPSTAGYGLIDAGKTWRADTTSPNGLATRLFAKTLPTSILTGQVAYSNGVNLVGSANYFWDNTNVRLGIGTNAPTTQLEITRTQNNLTAIFINNTNSSSFAEAALRLNTNSSGRFDFSKKSSSFSGYKITAANDANLYNSGNGDISILNDVGAGKIKFSAGASSTAQMTLAATGNLLLGTTTDVATSILTARSTTKSSSPFPLHTLAESDAITGVQGNFDYETTQNGLRWYNGTRKAYALESTFARGTATRVPFFDTNGQITQATGTGQNMRYYNAGSNLHILEVSSAIEAKGVTGVNSGNGDIVVSSATSAGGRWSFSASESTGSFSFFDALSVQSPVTIVKNAGNSRLTIAATTTTNTASASIVSTANSTTETIGSITDALGSTGHWRIINGSNIISFTSGSTSPYFAITNGTQRGYLQATTLDGVRLGSSSNHPLVFLTNGTVRGQFSTAGFLGLNTTTPLQDLDVNGDAYIRDSTRLTTTPAHSAITGLLTRDATGWVGLASVGTGLSYAAGVLSATGGGNSIYNNLPLGNVSINAAGNSLGISNIGELTLGGSSWEIYADDFETDIYNPEYAEIVAGTGAKIFLTDATEVVEVTGTLEANQYGTGTKEAADLSKTQSNYVAGFATDGTVLDLEIKRDTTIYVDDADLDFSAAITTAQISRRYNRIIFLMTTTGAAGSDSELTLHTPDANLMQCEILIRSTDEAGGFDNRILFGTNNAVSSTGTLASSYNPSAGQGLGLRVGLKGGVYKYFYY